MQKDPKDETLKVSINIKAVATAARNASSLEDAALEIDTLNPKKLTLDMEIYTLKAVPVNDKVKGKKKEFAPKVVGIKSMTVNSLSNTGKEGHITINGLLDVPKSGNRIVKLDECLFDDIDNAKAVAKVLTEIELEKASDMLSEAQEAVNFIQKQLEDERF